MHISILGSGNVGAALASVWTSRGHTVRFGTRDPGKPSLVELLSRLGSRASACKPAEAIAASEAVLLALPWSVTESTVKAHAAALAGKVLLDATNPLAPDLSGLTVGTNTSGGELVQQWAPDARVVKAFNTTGSDNMLNPTYRLTKLMMPFATDHEPARKVASDLISACSFEPIDAGPLAMSRALEPLALLWVKLAYQQGLGPHFGLALLRKPQRQ